MPYTSPTRTDRIKKQDHSETQILKGKIYIKVLICQPSSSFKVGKFNHNFIIISDNWYDFKTMDMTVPIGVSTSIAAVCLIYLLSFPRMVSRAKLFCFGKILANNFYRV